MILVDTTIVSVANPAIKAALDPETNNLDNVVWVTSAYLLAYAVPLLITGRLGDRFGPKRIYLIGLTVFTLASLWCGLSGSLEMLIAARAVQGLGAALMTPQTMAVITRTFPPEPPRCRDGPVGSDRRRRDARRARSRAACSWTASAGSGSSSSTSRSAWSPSFWHGCWCPTFPPTRTGSTSSASSSARSACS